MAELRSGSSSSHTRLFGCSVPEVNIFKSRTCPLALAVITLVLLAGCGSLEESDSTQTVTTPSAVATTPERSDGDLADGPPAQPAGIRFDPNSNPTPIVITVLPTAPPSRIFTDSNQPAYVPEQGFAPDARRILDIASLQRSLLHYWSALGTYPIDLEELFPDFAPLDEDDQPLRSPPTDPATHEPYGYDVSPDGQTFQLSAVMSNGAVFVVSEQKVRR